VGILALSVILGLILSGRRRDATACFDRGNLLTAKGEYGAAIEAFSTAIDLRSGFARAYLGRGFARAQTNDLDDLS